MKTHWNERLYERTPDFRLTCNCASCCEKTGRVPSRYALVDRRESEKLIRRLGWTDLLAAK